MGLEVFDEQSVLLRVATLVARETRLDHVFEQVSVEAANLLGIDATGVMHYLDDGRAVVVGVYRVGGARMLPVNAELDFDRAESALGRASTTKAPARVSSYDRSRGELPAVMRSMGMNVSIATPILIDGEPWGAIVGTAPDEEALPPGHEQRLVGLAELIAQAIVNDAQRAELAASRTRLLEAGDETRRRLERLLHEGAQQHVVALALKLRVGIGRTDPASAEAEVLRDALADAMEASAELSELARGLHPAVLSERGLAAALQAVAARSELPVNLRALPGKRHSAVIETTAYLMAAEALANAAVHARANECWLHADDRGEVLVVEVRDDGIGGAAVRPGGGLESIADRAAALGGTFLVESRAGGTAVRIEIPIAG
ncbi:GAF domain-containing protein [Solirubrobacter pauli]|uniref:histidine kinase n=1 Tax=Solirubrobacter pauli TaxID=166793 RepID=A0A660LIW9_9ACTN|nr:GAF domain-containing protein [Solirubrobacter pauli]RKQ93114.1 GAF domain-containing protein [Solirubrobacter pauli]